MEEAPMTQQNKSWTRGEMFSAIGLLISATAVTISLMTASTNKDIRCLIAHLDCNKPQPVTIVQSFSDQGTSQRDGSKSRNFDTGEKHTNTKPSVSAPSPSTTVLKNSGKTKTAINLVWPTKGTISSAYGRYNGKMHQGIDISGPIGTPVVAAADGVVVTSEFHNNGYGNLIEIRHSDGSITRYGHNNRLVANVGQLVKQGQHISDMGNTGQTTAPHLHFELQIEGKAVNPEA
jgi:murein DD-endopeptidase MepM/ murein hydrolase activator NlpD